MSNYRKLEMRLAHWLKGLKKWWTNPFRFMLRTKHLPHIGEGEGHFSKPHPRAFALTQGFGINVRRNFIPFMIKKQGIGLVLTRAIQHHWSWFILPVLWLFIGTGCARSGVWI